MERGSPGAVLFARYAYAPNELGYCGPADAHSLFGLGATGRTDVDVVELARRFTGAWPYQAILSELTDIADPLDERIGRAYWIGGALLDSIDRIAFGRELLAALGAKAGHYWQHLTPALLDEVSATHAFHVFGVYPWSRLLSKGPQALGVLDNCRIRWGRVIERDGDHVVVRSRRLTWDGAQLALGAAARERVRLEVDGMGFVTDPKPGEWLALHWDWVADRLRPIDLARLRTSTKWQLNATNRRLLSAG